jgi:hypothetical protein
MLAIADTVAAFAEHEAVATETTALWQRVQGSHGCPITQLLPMYRIVEVA